MQETWIWVIIVAGVILTGFLIALILELKKTIRSIDNLVKTTDQSLKPIFEELQQTLKKINNISSDINEVTSEAKTLSNTVRDVGISVKTAGTFVGHSISTTANRAMGFRAGIKTGLQVLLKTLLSKKGEKS
jgi:uncharacterized protein YoxC